MDSLELVVFLSIGALSVVPLLYHARRFRGRTWGIATLMAVGWLTVAVVWQPTDLDAVKPVTREIGQKVEWFLPHDRPQEGFATSNACRSCHPGAYASWHDTYHRTMTQVALPDTVLAPFDGRTLRTREREYVVQRKDDEFWVVMPDPEHDRRRMDSPVIIPPQIFLAASAEIESAVSPLPTVSGPSAVLLGQLSNYGVTIPLVERRIVMTTGSHNFQGYWVASSVGRELIQFPWIFNIHEKKWMPAEDAFIRPPEGMQRFAVWNRNCMKCHALNPKPGGQDALESEVSELGISCEACHGPATEHIRKHRNPLSRYVVRKEGDADPTIVNPAKATPEVASQICGQCHSAYQETNAFTDYWDRGSKYQAGGDLEESHHLFRFNDKVAKSLDEQVAAAAYWKDGTMRVGGREYLALLASPCYEKGKRKHKMSCISCHSMHESDPNDQLAAGMGGNQACLQCHQQIGDNLQAHTHHRPESSGSQCYNCHMPHTSYALFKAIRSHRVDSPSVEVTARTGKPAACNQCHLDKTLAWTATKMNEWYGHARPKLPEEHQTTAASLVWLLKGDAAQRAITAWSFTWKAAQEISGTDWYAPFLAELLDDPYAPVRFIAFDALRKLERHKQLPFDFVGGREHFAKMRAQVLEEWKPPESKNRLPELLMRRDGSVDGARLSRLLDQRDNRPITLPE